MKIERKITFVQSLVNVCLLVVLGLAGFAVSILWPLTGSANHQQTLLQIVLATLTLSVVLLLAVNFLFRKLYRQPISAKMGVDELTGFMTRQDFVQAFDHILLDSSRSQEPLCLLLIDVDYFRRINERYGERMGDRVLTELSLSIQTVLRNSDITCRWAGDQFLVVLKDCAVKDACRVAAKVLVAVRQQRVIDAEKEVQVTTSIGVAQMVTDDSIKSLLSRAETGLHSACDNGRNTFAIGYDWIILEYYSKPIF